MDHLTLDDTIRDQIATELGHDIPDPNSPDFERFLDKLKETKPELVDSLLQGLEVKGAELPEEAQVRKAERREGRRNLIRWLFYSQTYAGEPSFNKRKTLFVLVAMLSALLPLAFVADRVAQRRGSTDITQADSSSFQVAPVETDLPMTDFPNELPSAPNTPADEQTDLPPPPGPVVSEIAGTPPRSASISSAPLAVVEPSPVQPAALSIFETAPAPTTLSIGEESTVPTELSLIPSKNQTVETPEPATEQGLSVALGQEKPQSASTVTEGALPEDTSLTSTPDSEPQVASAATPSEDSSQLQDPTQENPQTSSDTPATLREEASLTNASSDAGDSSRFELQPGTQLPAELVTGIAVTQGVSSSIVAETAADGNWCTPEPCPAIIWLGTAQLERPGRVSVQLEQAVINGETRVISASAFDKDALPGLNAAMSGTSPTVAQDLLRATAGGVSDYLEALSEQQKVSLTDGKIVVEDLDLPSIDSFLLGRAAKLFDLPSDQTAIVRVAQVESGTTLNIFVGTSD